MAAVAFAPLTIWAVAGIFTINFNWRANNGNGKAAGQGGFTNLCWRVDLDCCAFARHGNTRDVAGACALVLLVDVSALAGHLINNSNPNLYLAAFPKPFIMVEVKVIFVAQTATLNLGDHAGYLQPGVLELACDFASASATQH